MSSNPDVSFFISEPGNTIPNVFAEDAEDILNIEADNSTAQPSAIVLKGDELRIIARKQDDELDSDHPGGASMNGSIRLIKEGVADDDLAMICLLKDGTVQISGSRIFLGRTPDDGGRGGGQGDNEAEPYMRYSDFCAWATAFTDAIVDQMTNLADEVNEYRIQLNSLGGQGAAGGSQFLWGPNAPLGAVWASMQAYFGARASFRTAQQQPKIDKVDETGKAYAPIASERIFGE